MELNGNKQKEKKKNGFRGDLVKVSIIIPIYNAEKYLRECLDSILYQDSEDFEIVCVNDGSKDKSLTILYEYKTKFNNMIILNLIHQGLSSRNKGLLVATGEYIYYVDADDIVKPDFIMKAYNICNDKHLDVLLFSFENFCNDEIMQNKYSHRINTTKRTLKFKDALDGKQAILKLMKEHEYYNMVWIQMVNKDFILREKLLFKEGIIFEDVVYTYRLLLSAKKVLCINEVGYSKRIHSESICGRTENLENVLSMWDNCKSIEEINLSLNIQDRDSLYIANRMRENVSSQFLLHYNRLDQISKDKFDKLYKIEINNLT